MVVVSHGWRFLVEDTPQEQPTLTTRPALDENLRKLLARRVEARLEASLAVSLVEETAQPEEVVHERSSAWTADLATPNPSSVDCCEDTASLVPIRGCLFLEQPPALSLREPQTVKLVPSRPTVENLKVHHSHHPRQKTKRVRAALEVLRAARAKGSVPKRRPPRYYGRWYLPAATWGRPEPAKKEAAAFKDAAWATEERQLDAHEQALQLEIGKAYIAKLFRQYVEERGFRTPRALAARADHSQTVRAHLVPTLSAMRAAAHFLKRDLKDKAVFSSSSQVSARNFRDVLSRHGFRFTDDEFRQLVAIATNLPDHHRSSSSSSSSRALKLDFNLFFLRVDHVLASPQGNNTPPARPTTSRRSASSSRRRRRR